MIATAVSAIDPTLDEGRHDTCVGFPPDRGEAVRFEEQREDAVGVGRRHQRPGPDNHLEMVAGGGGEGLGERQLEP